jgi:succinate dehydrogenase / fumarate reductase cytochrome b subunit
MLKASVVRKFVMGLSGLALVGFLIAHLAGNLLLFAPHGEAFNRYALTLENLGSLKIVAEIVLVILFGAHIVLAIKLTRENKRARPVKYALLRSKQKGGNLVQPQVASRTSRWMVHTGFFFLLPFLIFHIAHFTKGPGIEAGYVTQVDGEQARDLYRLVVEEFQNPIMVAVYVAVMLMMGIHLRHGFWSAFQSMGLSFPNWRRPIMALGFLLALALAAGFLLIPIWIFVKGV